MTDELFYNLIKLVMKFISVIIAPIDGAIYTLVPNVANAFTKVGFLFDYIGNALSWAVSLSGIPSETLTLIFLYFTFKLTAPFILYILKNGLKWYHYLKP